MTVRRPPRRAVSAWWAGRGKPALQAFDIAFDIAFDGRLSIGRR
ncbi:hypothetical protein [Kitasatospora sp. GP82]|nr:hypothetical protein [Kitasatospora sp. GP82]MDH6130125.1 hypothetical protein [Kitasatospora sp. GP82]